MVYESIDHENDVTCQAMLVFLFLVFREKKCYCKKQIDHNSLGYYVTFVK